MNETVLELHVTPNSKEFQIQGFDPWTGLLKVKVKSVPDKGKANQELIDGLKKFFGCEVTLISGKTSRKKKARIFCSKEKINEKIEKP